MRSVLKYKDISRRKFLGTTAAGVALAGVAAPNLAFGAAKTVKVGFLAPLTGEVAAWGLPGLYGCQIWAEQVNAAGGIKVGGDSYQVELVPYDNEYAPDKARTGATRLIREDGVKFIMMLGGDTWPAVQPIANKTGMLVSTLLPSDLSPDTKTLIAPCEVHPIYPPSSAPRTMRSGGPRWRPTWPPSRPRTSRSWTRSSSTSRRPILRRS